MNDGDGTKMSRAELDALLKKQDWGRIYPKLYKFARSRGNSKERAEDFTQEAIQRVLDPNWEPWDPIAKPDLVEFLMGIVRRLTANGRVTQRRHREVIMDQEADEGTDAERVATRRAKSLQGKRRPRRGSSRPSA